MTRVPDPPPPSLDGLMVDLDGVVWLGSEAIPGSVEALEQMRRTGVSLVFMTNDPRGSRGEYVARLGAVGFDATEDQIVTSASALATMIEKEESTGTRAFVIGSPSLKRELEGVGVVLLAADLAPEAEIVVVGGHEGFDFNELRVATQALRHRARLYGAGRDATFPMPEGPWPATGAILAAVETAGGVEATVVGKPEAYMFEVARGLLADCGTVAVVGDNLDADIVGGNRAGLFTVLVLSGTSSERHLRESAVQPDLVVPDLAALASALIRNSPGDR